MANKVLIAQNSVIQPYPAQSFAGSDSGRIVQFNPQVGIGFSGSVVIEGSYAPTPGNSDFTEIMSVTFTGHTTNLTLEVQSNAPAIRARIASSTQGAIAVVADSFNRNIQGSQGATPATALVDSANRVSGTGNGFKINSIVVPSITSDDVFYANDFTKTVTDMLDGTNGATGKQDKIGNITALEGDINLLTGTDAYGLTTTDLQKLADVNTTATELNWLSGTTSNIQTQINTVAATVPTGLSGLTATATTIDSFFDAAVTVSLTDLNALDGLTTTAADLNTITGTAGTFTAADLAKLGATTATAAELNKLSGYAGTSSDLNTLVGMTASSADLNAITGFAATTVTVTEMGYLSGLSQNVETALNSIPNLSGLSASVNDLNTLTGIFAGTGGYANPVSATEVSYLNGLTSSIQAQLNAKRDSSVSIGVAEISGASISTTELNYLQGSTANIQAQIDALGISSLTASGGSLTGQLFISNGTTAAPGLGFIAPNTTTGFYLFGANGLGVTVAGTQFVAADGVDLVVGPTAVVGRPLMKGVGFAVTDPAFSFSGDTDTGINRSGANAIDIVAGGEALASFDGTTSAVNIGGLVTTNNTVQIDGVFAGEKMLGRANILAGSVTGSVGQTALYTVPVGRSAIITKIAVRLTNVTFFVDGSLMRMNVGFGAAFDELVDNTTNVGIFDPAYAFNTANQVMMLGSGTNPFAAIAGSAGADYQVLTAGAILQADITALAGADDFNMEVIVFGHEYL